MKGRDNEEVEPGISKRVEMGAPFRFNERLTQHSSEIEIYVRETMVSYNHQFREETETLH